MQVLGGGQPRSSDASYTNHIDFSAVYVFTTAITLGLQKSPASGNAVLQPVCLAPRSEGALPLFFYDHLLICSCRSCSEKGFQTDGFYYRATREHWGPVVHSLLGKHKLLGSQHEKVQMRFGRV